jgi:parallel beta-helix repeat protein
MRSTIGISLAVIMILGGLLLYVPTFIAVPYYTPDTGVIWTMDDLVANSGGTVTGGGGTYVVTDHVYISQSDTLMVSPGEVIKFDPGVNLTIQGTLIADGDESNLITFTSNSIIPMQGDWGSIVFEDTSSDANCIVNYSLIEYSTYGINCEHASPKIINNNFTMNMWFGIVCNSSAPYIVNNSISSNLYGVVCGFPSQPIIRNNNISNNFLAGIFITDADPQIENNTISDSIFAILCTFGSPIIFNNTLSGPETNGVICTNVTDIRVYDNTVIDTRMVFINSSIDRLWLTNSTAITLNCTYPIPNLDIDPDSILIVQNYLHVKVLDDTDSPMKGALVNVFDEGILIYSEQTEGDGQAKWITVTDRVYFQSNNPIENRTGITVENGSWVFTCLTSPDPSDIDMYTSHLEIFKGAPGFSMNLEFGWNLISIPLIQSDTNLGSVLSSISGSYDAVQNYEASDPQDPWKHNHLMKPSQLNDLHDINHTIGFWIHINENLGTIFDYNGTTPTENQTILLSSGWNLVGFPSLREQNRTEGLNNIQFGSEVDVIQWYDATTRTWLFMNQDDSFVPERGYWVHSKIEITWEVPL